MATDIGTTPFLTKIIVFTWILIFHFSFYSKDTAETTFQPFFIKMNWRLELM